MVPQQHEEGHEALSVPKPQAQTSENEMKGEKGELREERT